MPFLTEALWQLIPHKGESIMMADWPQLEDSEPLPTDANAGQWSDITIYEHYAHTPRKDVSSRDRISDVDIPFRVDELKEKSNWQIKSTSAMFNPSLHAIPSHLPLPPPPDASSTLQFLACTAQLPTHLSVWRTHNRTWHHRLDVHQSWEFYFLRLFSCDITSTLLFCSVLFSFTEAGFKSLQGLVRTIRNARSEYNVEPGRKIAALVRLSSSSPSASVFAELLETEGIHLK